MSIGLKDDEVLGDIFVRMRELVAVGGLEIDSVANEATHILAREGALAIFLEPDAGVFVGVQLVHFRDDGLESGIGGLEEDMNCSGRGAATLDGDVIFVGIFVADVGEVARAGEVELAVGDDEPVGVGFGSGVVLVAEDSGRSIGKGSVKALSPGPKQTDEKEDWEVLQSDKCRLGDEAKAFLMMAHRRELEHRACQ